ncbi:hypothetical protein N7501_000887 [Penicillium viridicatum]|nr:hypothetical protein N7501_000887 [Penicillium viridicatum]
MAGETQLVVFAGEGTTAWTMHAALYQILANPVVCKELKAELATLNPTSDGVAALVDVEALPYLSAVIQKTTPCHPGVISRQIRLSPEVPILYTNKAIGKHYSVPPGTVYSMSPMDVHMNPDHFKYPYVITKCSLRDCSKLSSCLLSSCSSSLEQESELLYPLHIKLVLFPSFTARWAVGWKVDQKWLKNRRCEKYTVFGIGIRDSNRPQFASGYLLFSLAKLQSWLKKNPEWKEDGMVDYSALLICNMGIFDDKIGGEDSELSCEYPYPTSCPDGEAECDDEDSDVDDEGGNLEARSLEKRAGLRPSRLYYRDGGFLL